MLLVTSFLVFYITWTIADVSPPRDCKLTIQGKYTPLLLNGTHASFWYPKDFSKDKKLEVYMESGDSIHLACPGENNYLVKKDRTYKWDNMVEAVCVDEEFKINGIDQDFSSLVCEFPIESTVREKKHSCLDGHTFIKIGFNVNSGNNDIFIPTIESCRDEDTYTTYYTKFKMIKMIKTHENCPRKWFKWGKYYELSSITINMGHLYSNNNQRKTFAKILKSTKLDEKVRLKQQYLTRGHLAAKADFVYFNLQNSTFSYINTAPQWNTFNAGNWKRLEEDIRDYVHTKKLDLDVYTGVHDQMTMKVIDGTHQSVFLNLKYQLIPVPKFFWKVIYDPNNRRGTAFVGLNDPFIESITNDVYLCTPIKSNIIRLNWKPRDIKAGVSYACSVADLQNAVPTVPQLDVIDLLN